MTKTLSFGRFAGAALVSGLTFLLQPAAGPAQVPVLMYHAHPNLGYNEDVFRQHMDHLVEEGFTTITPDQFLFWRIDDEPLPPRPVLLTVDDNYILTYTSMWPILQERDMMIVNFVITNAVGRQTGLHYCSWEELREMEASGVVINESHTESHPFLTQLSPQQSFQELAGSKRALEENLVDRQIRYICYPYGDFNLAIEQRSIAAGYAAGFSTIPGLNYRDTPLFEIRRQAPDYMNLPQFQDLMAFEGHYPPPPGEGWALDNEMAHFTHEPTAWNRHQASSGAYGSTYVSRGPGSGAIRARWAVVLPETGWYRVHAWWAASSSNASNAPYEIHHAGGTETIRADQRTVGSQWNALGAFFFHKDTPAKIFLHDDADGTIIADAVWLEPVEGASASGWVLR